MSLTVTASGDRDIVMTRADHSLLAPRESQAGVSSWMPVARRGAPRRRLQLGPEVLDGPGFRVPQLGRSSAQLVRLFVFAALCQDLAELVHRRRVLAPRGGAQACLRLPLGDPADTSPR